MGYVTITAPQKIEDQDFERSLDDCPQLDFRTSPSEAAIEQHLLAVFCYYFNLEAGSITASSHLVTDIERAYWAKQLGVPKEEVTYGRLFCGQDEQGNPTGGMSDEGLLMYLFLTEEIDLITGVHFALAPEALPQEGWELEDAPSVEDWQTVGDMVRGYVTIVSFSVGITSDA